MPATRPHDLDLPAWGPYSKRYAGCSHIPDPDSGVRLDVSVFPGFHRGRLDIPQIAYDSGWTPWLAAPDGSFHAFKHQLEWRDQVTVETAYAALPDGDGRVVTCRCRNRTTLPQTLDLHLVLGCQYPTPRPSGHAPPPMARPAVLALPAGGSWVDARDAASRSAGTPRPLDGLCYDGWTWHEQVEDGCVDGGYRWLEAGDRSTWRLAPATDAVLWLRLRVAAGGRATIEVDGASIALTGTGTWAWTSLPHPGGPVTLHHAGGARVDLDVLCLTPPGAPPQTAPRQWLPRPDILPGPCADSTILRWPDLPPTYGVWWGVPGRLRQWHAETLDDAMRRAVHDHVSAEFRGAGEGHWCDFFADPLVLAPGEEREVRFAILAGRRDEIEARLTGLDAGALAAAHAAGRAGAWSAAGNPSGAELAPGQRLMAATLCTNIVYPVYTRRRFVRHHCPGKAWDSLYSWDSGFLGIGLLELDAGRCAGTLEQYLMPEGDPDCAFLHHGSPVPVQLHLAHELWNRTRDRDRFARIYPSLRQWYRFLVGRHGSSDTARLGSGLLATWSLFYNSGGWDDYPPQKHVHEHGLAARVAPMVTTCHAIAAARMLKQLAHRLGRDDDAEYDADITRLGAAVQTHAWDAAEGFYGYVVHDEALQPSGLLRHAGGSNLNRGLDGCCPLLAGICTPGQERTLLGHLAAPGRLWSPVGLSTVDQAAPWFRPDGYWNGAVWMPHQWFFWKRLLDLGQADLAYRIATTALELWRRETAASERCWEHFPIASGRGAGWHHFGALSSPVLAWYAALHIPGRLSGGQDLWVEDLVTEGRGLRARLAFCGAPGRTSTVIICLPPGPVVASWGGTPIALRPRHPGCWEVDLPADASGELVVCAG